jgi:hypothetical protein
MSKTLSFMLMNLLKPSQLCWWNVYNPLIYAVEMSITLSSILLKCLQPSHLCWWNVFNPVIYTDEMSTTLSINDHQSMGLCDTDIHSLHRSLHHWFSDHPMECCYHGIYHRWLYLCYMVDCTRHLFRTHMQTGNEMSKTLSSMLMKCL